MHDSGVTRDAAIRETTLNPQQAILQAINLCTYDRMSFLVDLVTDQDISGNSWWLKAVYLFYGKPVLPDLLTIEPY